MNIIDTTFGQVCLGYSCLETSRFGVKYTPIFVGAQNDNYSVGANYDSINQILINYIDDDSIGDFLQSKVMFWCLVRESIRDTRITMTNTIMNENRLIAGSSQLLGERNAY